MPGKRCGGGTACPSFAAGAGRAVLVRARGALGPTMGALGCTGGARGSTAAGRLAGAGPEGGAAAGPAVLSGMLGPGRSNTHGTEDGSKEPVVPEPTSQQGPAQRHRTVPAAPHAQRLKCQEIMPLHSTQLFVPRSDKCKQATVLGNHVAAAALTSESEAVGFVERRIQSVCDVALCSAIVQEVASGGVRQPVAVLS